MLNKFIAALISTFLSSIILTVLYFDALGNGFLLFLSITGGVYILVGIPSSMLIDNWAESKWLKLLYFIVIGFVVGILTILVFILSLSAPSNGYTLDLSTILRGCVFGLYGSIGAFIFYIIENLLKVFKRQEVN